MARSRLLLFALGFREFMLPLNFYSLPAARFEKDSVPSESRFHYRIASLALLCFSLFPVTYPLHLPGLLAFLASSFFNLFTDSNCQQPSLLHAFN